MHGLRRRQGRIVEKLLVVGLRGRSDPLPETFDEPLAAADHGLSGGIDRIDEIAVDENADQNPAHQQQNDRSESTDAAAQQFGHRDAESTAPPGRTTKTAAGSGHETQGQRTENHDQAQREHRVVEQHGALADDADAHEHQHDGHQDAADAQRTVDQQDAQPGPCAAAPVADRLAKQLGLLARLAEDTLVGLPTKKRRKERHGGEHPDAEQQQADDPADAVGVAPLNPLPCIGRSGGVSGCHDLTENSTERR